MVVMNDVLRFVVGTIIYAFINTLYTVNIKRVDKCNGQTKLPLSDLI